MLHCEHSHQYQVCSAGCNLASTLSHMVLHSVIETMSTDADVVNSWSATNFIEPDVIRSIPPIFCARNLTYPVAFGVIECPHLLSCGGTSSLSVCACVVVTVICLFFFCCFLCMVAVGVVSIVLCCVVCIACGLCCMWFV